MFVDEIAYGFKPIPVKFVEDSNTQRCFFIKEHSVREKVEDKPGDRTLFVLNVPPYCNEDCLKRIFGNCGKVASVFFHQKPYGGLPQMEESTFFPKYSHIKGYKVAYVVFEEASGLETALKLDSHVPVILSTPESPLICGMEKWCQEYNKTIVNTEDLQKEINDFMDKFDDNENKMLLKEKEAMEEDSEGWIKVTRKGRRPGFARKESVRKKIMHSEKLKRSQKELHNFYRFQIRESKMKYLVNLRKKFEEDKKRINTLKQSRRFKPY